MKTRKQSGNRKSKSDLKPAFEAPLTLDDVSSLLMQTEPSDRRGFERLKAAVRSAAEEDGVHPEAATFLYGAIEKIDGYLNGVHTDGEDVLFELSRLLEAATDANEMGDSAPASVSPAPPRTQAPEVRSPEAHGEAPESRGAQPASSTPQENRQESRTADTLPPDADHDMLGEFVTESLEFIESAEAALLALETDSDDQEAVNSVFRAFHTIKGTSGFLGLTRVTELAHRAESLLSRVRNKEILCTGIYADLTLRSIDVLKELVQSIREALAGGVMVLPAGYEGLLKDLANPESAARSMLSTEDAVIAGEASSDGPSADEARSQHESFERPAAQPGNDRPSSDRAKSTRATQKTAANETAHGATLRVRTDRLDRLIDTVGELVIAQSMVAQDKNLSHDHLHELLRKVAHTGKIVRELQDLSMSMRMVPLRATFQKMHRLVRDVAHKSGKQIHLISEDGETEIDRHMVDIINDLLVHMVRNAVDHGIESPEIRKKCGKAEAGTIRLRAFHSGGSVVVEIQDDGRGLDRDTILKKALASGLLPSEKAVSDSEVYNLIFAPGFSTAERITDISGRGVGMDVVRKGVETLHGRVDISTIPGQGSTFSVRLPLTLAITDGMLVKVGPERYIIPTINIHRCIRPAADQLSTISGRGEMILLRGDLMPIFRLHKLFDIPGATENPIDGLLVVVGDGERRCTLLVDELLGQQQFVAKSLGDGVGKVQGVTGGAIMGDGQVGLILDTAEIIGIARQQPAGFEGSGRCGRSAA